MYSSFCNQFVRFFAAVDADLAQTDLFVQPTRGQTLEDVQNNAVNELAKLAFQKRISPLDELLVQLPEKVVEASDFWLHVRANRVDDEDGERLIFFTQSENRTAKEIAEDLEVCN